MRIAFHRSLQPRAEARLVLNLPSCLTLASPRFRSRSGHALTSPPASPIVRCHSHLNHRRRESDRQRTRPTTYNRDKRRGTDTSKELITDGRGSSLRDLKHLLGLSADQRHDPASWIDLLERHLSPLLRNKSYGREVSEPVDSSAATAEILDILFHAQRATNLGSDLLAYMIIHGKRKAALWICDRLLSELHAQYPQRFSQSTPSNVLWPKGSLEDITTSSISVSHVPQEHRDSTSAWHDQEHDPRYAFEFSDVKNSTMAQVWYTLGSLVAQSANVDEGQGQDIMNAVHLILGRVHKLDLVPGGVYDYHPSPFSAATQKPPIVHLVSSRILTALSDAAWRQQQDEVIEKAASHGTSYKDIGRDPPGGRFRLKVSPMGAEVWLEFILWCCVEGGFATVGSRIINLLRQEAKDPWFAITWSAGRGPKSASAQVDWDRVRSRSGGTVGRIEGYSRDKPLAEVPLRTISTEVVLALVECNVNTVQRETNVQSKTLALVSRNIVGAISFLEPHDLPVSYFDYITGRLLMADCFEHHNRAYRLAEWIEKLSFMKSLRPVQKATLPRVSFRLEDLAAHSEFGAGLVHQLLHAHLSSGDIHQALRSFDQVQRLVDNSKLHAIGVFLQEVSPAHDAFFSSRPFSGSLDFIDSHGQLPLYKLVALLNLATETRLIGFGHWLLYNQDPDGPLLPPKSYRLSSVANALVRFAGVSGDERLLKDVPTLSSDLKRLETVSFLRASFNARISLLDFEGASRILERLTRAQAGGFGLANLAHLAGTIVKLESSPMEIGSLSTGASSLHTKRATDLLHSMLKGEFNTKAGIFTLFVRTTFRQQISHLLSVFRATHDSSVASVASIYSNDYPVTNMPNLPPSILNLYLEQIMETKTANYGMNLVDTLCTDSPEQLHVSLESPENTLTDDEESDLALRDPEDGFETTKNSRNATTDSFQSFVPFVRERNEIAEGASGHTTGVMRSVAPSMPGETEDGLEDEQDEASLDAVKEETGGVRPQQPTLSAEGLKSGDPASATFSSPFFGTTPKSSSPSSINLTRNDTREPEQSVNPVCVTDPRTIRLIARSALRERYERQSQGIGIQRQNDVLKWARRRFTELGFSLPTIMSEIAEPLEQADLSRMKVTTRGNPVPQWANRVNPVRFRRPSRISNAFRGRPTSEKIESGKSAERRDGRTTSTN